MAAIVHDDLRITTRRRPRPPAAQCSRLLPGVSLDERGEFRQRYARSGLVVPASAR
jgi:hypothetical protein